MEGQGLRKSDGDLKDYRVVTLSGSNLECLLVSSVNTSKVGDNVKAAAAMSVQVGSFADPTVAGKRQPDQHLDERVDVILLFYFLQRGALISWR